MERLIENLKINDKIDETMLKKLMITNEENEDDDYIFRLDEWAVFTKSKFNEKLRMKFLKIWSILRIPIIDYKRGYCEWRIRGNDNDIYLIRSSHEDHGKSLLQRENWIITANTNDKDKISKFLKHFSNAIDCYETYYSGIEIGNFTSNIPIVQDALDEMKTELFTKSSIFNKNF